MLASSQRDNNLNRIFPIDKIKGIAMQWKMLKFPECWLSALYDTAIKQGFINLKCLIE